MPFGKRALVDSVTGLRTRADLHQSIQDVVSEKPEGTTPSAFLLVDIDRFAEINRALGFRRADAVLAAFSKLLAAQLRADDVLARHDGARFGIWMPDASQRFEVLQLAQRLLRIESVSIAVSQEAQAAAEPTQAISISVSVGCALFPEHGVVLDELVQAAQAALQVAKQAGGNQVQLANIDLAPKPNSWSLQNTLAEAIQNDQLVLHYQPVFQLTDKKIVAVEALLRPKIESLAGHSTESIMGVAEQLPVIAELTRWGLLEACRAARAVNQHRAEPISIAVNLPPVVMQHPQLVNWVQEALDQVQIPANLITLELTERSLADGDTLVIRAMHQLKELGCLLAMDDFGVGYTALAQWLRLPIDKVKFDRSLLPTDLTQTKSVVLIKHLLKLAHELGLTTVFEGVEHRAQWDLLGGLGCDQAQGYWLARPTTLDGLSELLRATDKH